MQLSTDKLMQDLRAVIGDAEELLKATAGVGLLAGILLARK